MGDAASVGLIGLGTMGAMLALNIAENGFGIAVFNRTTERTRAFVGNAGALADRIVPCETLEAFVAAQARPRRIILMVPAGQAVDDQISALRPLLDREDLIIDAGNSDFRDTERRAAAAEEIGGHHIGAGVSGGEEGARHGPSIMAGGSARSWDCVEDILLAIAASFEGVPCAGRVGPGGAGHFVKTVHNGIEYADMQIIAEGYGLLRDGLGLSPTEIGGVFDRWNAGPLRSYLVEITAKIGPVQDPVSGTAILDVISDKAGQKGTGRWAVIEAQTQGVPVPTIEAAVAARNISARKAERLAGEARFGPPPGRLDEGAMPLERLEAALVAAKILCYAQGFSLIEAASRAHDWSIDLARVARLWRAGCIIRSAMLDDMASALASDPGGGLVLSDHFSDLLDRCVPDLRAVVLAAVGAGLPVAALGSALGYFDAMRTGRSTANMIQAQRDFFGAHGFERIDAEGTDHHGPWAMRR